LEKLAEHIFKFPKTILLSILILAAASVYPASHIRTDFNLEGFFPKNDATIKEYERFTAEFGRDDNVILIGIERKQLFEPAVLRDIKTITDSVKTISNVLEVQSLWTVKEMNGETNRLYFKPYLLPGKLDSLNLPEIKQKMLQDPFIGGILLSEDGTFTAISIKIDDAKDAYTTRQQILDDLNRTLKPYRSVYDFKFSGIPYFRNTYVNLLNDEIIFFVAISSLFILIVLFVLYRSVAGLVLPIIIVWLTVLFTVAAVQITGGFFEILSSTIAPILLCVGIADSIHMISKYDDGIRHGLSKKTAIKEMLVTLGSATLLTSITTAIGFATLFSSNVTPMKRFGIYTAAGVLLAYLITILLLPSSLTIFPVKEVLKSGKTKIYSWIELKLRQLDAYNKKCYKSIVIIGFIVTSFVSLGAFNMTINSRVFDDIGRDTQVIKDSNYLSDKLTPPFPMEFVIDTGTPGGIKEPKLLHKIEEFEQHLLNYAPVKRVTSVNTILKKLHANMVETAPNSNELPWSKSLIAQYLLLLEFNDAAALDNYIDFDYQKTRVSVRMVDNGSKTTNAIRADLKEYIQKYFSNVEVTITGTTILVADLTDNIVYSLTASILLAFLGISVIMALLFKNIKLVVISLVPNIMPLLFVAGVMGYLNIYIKPSTAVIFTIAFGIAVDDSIHYLARYRVESKRGASMREALQISTLKTGKAIIITSLILITGFGTLTLSQFTSTMLMGSLICLTIFIALLADLHFLPALFYWLNPKIKFSSLPESETTSEISESKSREHMEQEL